MLADTDTFLAGGNGVVVALLLLWHVLLKLANGLACPGPRLGGARARAGPGPGPRPVQGSVLGLTRANSDAAWVDTHKKGIRKADTRFCVSFAFASSCLFAINFHLNGNCQQQQ